MQSLHHHVDGVPRLKPHPLFRCETCLKVKATKRAVTASAVQHALKIPIADPTTEPGNASSLAEPLREEKPCRPGEQFRMDMGFVRGTQFSYRDKDGTLVTSLDGYNSYLLIVDKATRYTWVFLARSKHPQIEIIQNFLKMHGSKNGTQRYIRTDAGGELWSSHAFQKMAFEEGFIPQVTAADASFQNGAPEPHLR